MILRHRNYPLWYGDMLEIDGVGHTKCSPNAARLELGKTLLQAIRNESYRYKPGR